MVNRINIENKELLVILEFDDEEYGKIIMCLDNEDRKVFVINNKIVTDKSIIGKINEKYGLEFPKELRNVIF